MSQATTPQDRITTLRRELDRHNKLYYAGTPEIADTEFDRLYIELVSLETAHPELYDAFSPTQRVGGPVSVFDEMPFALPMLSIDNCFDLDALDGFHDSVLQLLGCGPNEPTYAVEYKIDGAAMQLTYEGGHLTLATTRGDGTTGEVVLHTAKTIRDIPLVLRMEGGRTWDKLLEIRGEVYIPHSVFAQVQAAKMAAGEEEFANSRNAAAGGIRQHDPQEARRRQLRFFVHGFGMVEMTNPHFRHSEFMHLCQTLGFQTIPHSADGLTYPNAKQHINDMIELLPTLDFPIDGIVLKLEQKRHRDALGVAGKYPRWARAYKWERYEAVTTVNDIVIQVGKRGTLTPVAELAPVEIAETMVSRASLFNAAEIERRDIRIGDRVVVEKAGKIIPHVLRVEPRERAMPKYHFPTTCPACGSDVIMDGAHTLCNNPTSCPAQIHATLVALGARNRLDIDGLGPTLVQKLMDAKLVNSIGELYDLASRREAILAVDGIGEGKCDAMLHGIEASKNQESWRQLAAWNIKHCGTTMSRLLMRRFRHVDQLVEAAQSMETLQQLPGVGIETATGLHRFFTGHHGQALVAKLRSVGVNLGERDPAVAETPQGSSRALDGLKIVPTGEMQGWDRDGIKDEIRRHGGIPTSSVSGKTNLILAGTAPGAKKLEKARELGIEVIDEARFREMIGATVPS